MPYTYGYARKLRPDEYNTRTKKGRWRFKELLGYGSYGCVWKCEDMTRRHASPVALKVSFFRRESGMAFNLHLEYVFSRRHIHNNQNSGYNSQKADFFIEFLEDCTSYRDNTERQDNVLQSCTLMQWPKYPKLPARNVNVDELEYVVMEFCPGQTVRNLVKKSCFTLKETRKVMMESAMALDYLSQLETPLIHRDFRSSNMLWRETDATNGQSAYQLKVVDYGLMLPHVKGMDKNQSQRCRVMPTEWSYWFPPETHNRSCNYSGPSTSFDVFSLAALAYEIYVPDRSKNFRDELMTKNHAYHYQCACFWASLGLNLTDVIFFRCLYDAPGKRPKPSDVYTALDCRADDILMRSPGKTLLNDVQRIVCTFMGGIKDVGTLRRDTREQKIKRVCSWICDEPQALPEAIKQLTSLALLGTKSQQAEKGEKSSYCEEKTLFCDIAIEIEQQAPAAMLRERRRKNAVCNWNACLAALVKFREELGRSKTRKGSTTTDVDWNVDRALERIHTTLDGTRGETPANKEKENKQKDAQESETCLPHAPASPSSLHQERACKETKTGKPRRVHETPRDMNDDDDDDGDTSEYDDDGTSKNSPYTSTRDASVVDSDPRLPRHSDANRKNKVIIAPKNNSAPIKNKKVTTNENDENRGVNVPPLLSLRKRFASPQCSPSIASPLFSARSSKEQSPLKAKTASPEARKGRKPEECSPFIQASPRVSTRHSSSFPLKAKAALYSQVWEKPQQQSSSPFIVSPLFGKRAVRTSRPPPAVWKKGHVKSSSSSSSPLLLANLCPTKNSMRIESEMDSPFPLIRRARAPASLPKSSNTVVVGQSKSSSTTSSNTVVLSQSKSSSTIRCSPSSITSTITTNVHGAEQNGQRRLRKRSREPSSEENKNGREFNNNAKEITSTYSTSTNTRSSHRNGTIRVEKGECEKKSGICSPDATSMCTGKGTTITAFRGRHTSSTATHCAATKTTVGVQNEENGIAAYECEKKSGICPPADTKKMCFLGNTTMLGERVCVPSTTTSSSTSCGPKTTSRTKPNENEIPRQCTANITHVERRDDERLNDKTNAGNNTCVDEAQPATKRGARELISPETRGLVVDPWVGSTSPASSLIVLDKRDRKNRDGVAGGGSHAREEEQRYDCMRKLVKRARELGNNHFDEDVSTTASDHTNRTPSCVRPYIITTPAKRRHTTTGSDHCMGNIIPPAGPASTTFTTPMDDVRRENISASTQRDGMRTSESIVDKWNEEDSPRVKEIKAREKDLRIRSRLGIAEWAKMLAEIKGD